MANQSPVESTGSVPLRTIRLTDTRKDAGGIDRGSGTATVGELLVGASAIAITYLLPSPLTSVDATSTAGSYASGSGLWSIPNLAGGASATLTVRTRVVGGPATYTPPATPTATPTSVTPGDAVAANNSAQATLTTSTALATDNRTPVTCVAKAVSKASKIKVDMGPDLPGDGSYAFRLDVKRDGKWFRYLHNYRTKAATETRTINVPKGTYRAKCYGPSEQLDAKSGRVTIKK